MGIFGFFKGKTNDVLTSVFTVAEKGMYNINFSISQEGRFEVAMFDIWLGTMLMEEQHINIDYMLMQNKIEEYLKQTVLNLVYQSKKNMKEHIFSVKRDGSMMLWG